MQSLLALGCSDQAIGASAADLAGILVPPRTVLTSWPGCRYRGDHASSVAVGPGGRKVFVTGSSPGTSGGACATIAYNAVTGTRPWVARYGGLGAAAVVVSPDGGTVFVTGSVQDATTGVDYATVAYSAVSGRQLWVAHYNGSARYADDAVALAVSPDGGTVFMTGSSWQPMHKCDYATVAYNAAPGKQRWAVRYSGYDAAYSQNFARSVAVSPSGAAVFVTGQGADEYGNGVYATVAYSAATGRELWAARYRGPGNGNDQAFALAVSPDGTRIFVTGSSWGRASSYDYATIAYRS